MVFWHWAKFFQLLSRSFWRGWQNCILHVHRNNSRKHTFFVKISNFYQHSRTRSKKTSASCRKVSVGVVTTESYMSSGTFGGRTTLCKTFSFFHRFLTLNGNFSNFCRKVSVGFVKTASYMSLQIFGERINFCKVFFIFLSFSDIEPKILTFCREVFEEVDKTESCMSTGAIRGDILSFVKILIFSIILGHWAKNFGLLSKTFRRVCHNCILSCLYKHLEEE